MRIGIVTLINYVILMYLVSFVLFSLIMDPANTAEIEVDPHQY